MSCFAVTPPDEAPLPASFDDMPAEQHTHAYGVDYVRLDRAVGGQVWVTRDGWRVIDHVLPTTWFCHQEYARDGEKLATGTGSVFHVPTISEATGRRQELVIKFSRVGQDVPVLVSDTFLNYLPTGLTEEADFADPFYEFGMLEALRRSHEGQPGERPIRTAKPLAIYSPPREYPVWQLGRHAARFDTRKRLLDANVAAVRDAGALGPESAEVELLLNRDYILIYEWVKGRDAEQLHRDGLVPEAEMIALTQATADLMRSRGFVVIDHKPRHLICRPRRPARPDHPHRDRRAAGQPIRRPDPVTGQPTLAWALIDYELLLPWPDHPRRPTFPGLADQLAASRG
ncbi:MAG: hypothetical protein AAGI54_11680 [Planctomycetota bacterium]